MWVGTASSALRLYVQTGPGSHPTSCAMSAGSLSQGKVAGAWSRTPIPSSVEVKRKSRNIPLLHSPTGPSPPVLGRALPFYVCLIFDLTHVTERKTKWVGIMKWREWMYILKQFLTYLIQGRAKRR